MANADVFAKMRPPPREKLSAMAPGTKNEPMVAMPQVEDQKVAPYTATERPVVSEPPLNPSGPAATAPIRAKGSGGYVYDVMPDNTIRIVQSSRGKGGQIVTEDSEFYDLIMDDIKKYAGKPDASASKPASSAPRGVVAMGSPSEFTAELVPEGTVPDDRLRMQRTTPPAPKELGPARAPAPDMQMEALVWSSMVKNGMDGTVAAKAVRAMGKTALEATMSTLAQKQQLVPAEHASAAMQHYEDALLTL